MVQHAADSRAGLVHVGLLTFFICINRRQNCSCSVPPDKRSSDLFGPFFKSRNSISPLKQSCMEKKKKKEKLQRSALRTNKMLSKTYSVNCRIILFLPMREAKLKMKQKRWGNYGVSSVSFPPQIIPPLLTLLTSPLAAINGETLLSHEAWTGLQVGFCSF